MFKETLNHDLSHSTFYHYLKLYFRDNTHRHIIYEIIENIVSHNICCQISKFNSKIYVVHKYSVVSYMKIVCNVFDTLHTSLDTLKTVAQG